MKEEEAGGEGEASEFCVVLSVFSLGAGRASAGKMLFFWRSMAGWKEGTSARGESVTEGRKEGKKG